MSDPTDGRTHYDGCWHDRRHHDCAVREIERLRRERDELRAALGTYGRHSDDCDDANAYNGERRGSCGCGLDAALREAGR